jgi:C1A family cysteine protease
VADYGLGYIKDVPDSRDFVFKLAAPAAPVKLPSRVDLTTRKGQLFPPVFDQGQLGSCTAQASAAALAYRGLKTNPVRSRLEIYYNARLLLGPEYASQDSGARIRDVFKSLNAQGARPEADWPYVISKFVQKPQPDLDPLTQKLIQYERVPQTETALKTALANGYPVVFGITVYESFMSDAVAKTGTVPLPGPNEQAVGGHALLIVGYYPSGKTKKTRYKFRNSWGEEWGQKGYGSLPAEYVLNPDLAGDFWIVKAYGETNAA